MPKTLLLNIGRQNQTPLRFCLVAEKNEKKGIKVVTKYFPKIEKEKTQ